LDDCASRFKTWVKKSTIIKQIFYEFRHNGGTTIMTAQNDKEIDSEYRKNVMVSIFTDERSAVSNFTRGSNSFGKSTKAYAEKCIAATFAQAKNEPKHYKKLVHFNNSPDPFRYVQADLYDDFKVGSKAIWLLDQEADNHEEEEQKNNPLFEKYL
jgi:hypothetical protein